VQQSVHCVFFSYVSPNHFYITRVLALFDCHPFSVVILRCIKQETCDVCPFCRNFQNSFYDRTSPTNIWVTATWTIVLKSFHYYRFFLECLYDFSIFSAYFTLLTAPVSALKKALSISGGFRGAEPACPLPLWATDLRRHSRYSSYVTTVLYYGDTIVMLANAKF